MKKIFFFVSILGFSFVSAQQKGIFDIQKHLQQKFKQEQDQKQKEHALSFLKRNQLFLQWPSPPQARLSHILANGNKVYLLPQDNMPCIVPDMGQFNMPNLAKGKRIPGKMPNAAIPYKIIPGNDGK